NADAPGDQLGWRPLQMGTMRSGHVLADGDESALAVLAQVAGDAPTTMKDLHHPGRGADLHGFAHELIRDRVVPLAKLDVVVDVDLGGFPDGELVPGLRQ